MIKYLVIINIIAIVLYLLNLLLYSFTSKAQIDSLITIICFLGGSFGILIMKLIFDRKIDKKHEETIMSSVFLYSLIPIQIALLLFIIKGSFNVSISKFITFFKTNHIFSFYLLVINIISFITYMLDKLFAIKKKSRIKIATLLFIAFIGGSLGALLAMDLFKHKTNKDYFSVGVPLILLMHLIVLLCIIFIL